MTTHSQQRMVSIRGKAAATAAARPHHDTGSSTTTLHGPWGDALRYWLEARGLRQADLVKATNLQPKTISRIVRGFHTQTRVLEQIARYLGVPVEQVLVSPLRGAENHDQRKSYLQAAVESALRATDPIGAVDAATLDLARRVSALPPEIRQSVLTFVGQYEAMAHANKSRVDISAAPSDAQANDPPRRRRR